MSVRRPILAGVTVLAAAALSAGIGVATAPHAHASTVVHSGSKVSHTTQVRAAKATRQYKADLSPSMAWQLAPKAERRNAERAYLAEFGSWEEGCKADLHHAYQGKTGKGGLHNVQPWLPVSRLHVPGRDIYLGQYVTGVCK